MKVIIAGSRHLEDARILEAAMIAARGASDAFIPSEVVCGMAKGADTLGMEWASRNGLAVKGFPADWSTYGKAAGPIRNMEMAKYADSAIVIWNGRSAGSGDMIRCTVKLGKPYFSYIVDIY